MQGSTADSNYWYTNYFVCPRCGVLLPRPVSQIQPCPFCGDP